MKMVTLNHNPFLNFLREDFTTKTDTNFLAKIPAANLLEGKENFSIELAAPSYEKADFKIEIDKNILTISTEKADAKEGESEKYSRREFAYTSFSRSFTLPKDIKKDEISATYEGGVLKLRLPRVEKIKQEALKIEVA